MSGVESPPAPTAEQVEGIYAATSNWGRWGTEDEAGTLNLLTDERRAAAASLVRSGRTVSLGHDLPTIPVGGDPVAGAPPHAGQR